MVTEINQDKTKNMTIGIEPGRFTLNGTPIENVDVMRTLDRMLNTVLERHKEYLPN